MLAALIYPHQLFPNHPAISQADLCVLIEEPLLFAQYRFHAQKLVLHIASMNCYKRLLQQQGKRVRYIESREITATADISPILKGMSVTQVQFVDPNDDWLQQRLTQALDAVGIDWIQLDDPHFLTPTTVFDEFAAKPYISGSSYVLKMSRFRKGSWCPIWDALYWRFIYKHEEFFAANPRMSVMTAQCRKMGTKLDAHLKTAETFLAQLHQR